MQVRMSFLVELDPAGWAKTYGDDPREDANVILEYFEPYFNGSEDVQGTPGATCSSMEIVQSKITVVKAGPKPTNKRSTAAVISFLMDPDPYKKGHGGRWERWESLPKASVAEMKEEGVKYLRDKSEFTGGTIETVDWEEVYNTFHGE